MKIIRDTKISNNDFKKLIWYYGLKNSLDNKGAKPNKKIVIKNLIGHLRRLDDSRAEELIDEVKNSKGY